MPPSSVPRLRAVPRRALAISAGALAVPVIGSVLFVEALAAYRVLLWLLLLVPAFLLAHYRRWRGVSIALGVGVAVLTLTIVVGSLLGREIHDIPIVLLVATPYIAIALGAGWLRETSPTVTERLRAEEALRRLERALDTMQLGVTVTDVEGRIVYANPADARRHGYAVDELIGRDVGIYAPPASRRPLTLQQLRELSSRTRESVNVRKDGTVFPVLLRSDVIVDASGEPLGVVTTCEDITERKEAEEDAQRAYRGLRKSHLDLQATQLQLVEAEKLESIGRLAAGVAHEVKNPLMMLLTGVRYLSNHLPSDDENVAILLEDMAEAIKRADAVIRGLLDYSAPRELEMTAEDVNALVQRSLLLVKHELDRGQITVVQELGEDVPAVPLDSFKVQQVLVNVFTNAVHATPRGGTVSVKTCIRPVAVVSTEKAGISRGRFTTGAHVVVVQVDDTGTGIPDEKLGKIFDPFFTTKPTGEGTGLGLSVSRQIIEMHGGSIDIRNREEGGARVTIVFRLQDRGSDDGKEAYSAR